MICPHLSIYPFMGTRVDGRVGGHVGWYRQSNAALWEEFMGS